MQNYIKLLKEICHDNKYTTWYISIILNSTSTDCKHHIIPDRLFINRTRKGKKGFLNGNPNDPENISSLSNREHFIVHMLLPKMLKNKYYAKIMSSAISRMMDKKYYNSRSYETARKIISNNHWMKLNSNKKIISKQLKKFYSSEKGQKFMQEKAETQKTTMIGKGNPMFGKESGFKNKSHSQDHINKLKEKRGENHHRSGIPGKTKYYQITTPNGETFIINNLSEFCRQHNLSNSGMSEVANNNRSNHKNYHCKILIFPNAILIDPNKKEHTVFNIKQFCRENNLHYQCIISVIAGRKPQHKGWVGYKYDPTQEILQLSNMCSNSL